MAYSPVEDKFLSALTAVQFPSEPVEHEMPQPEQLPEPVQVAQVGAGLPSGSIKAIEPTRFERALQATGLTLEQAGRFLDSLGQVDVPVLGKISLADFVPFVGTAKEGTRSVLGEAAWQGMPMALQQAGTGQSLTRGTGFARQLTPDASLAVMDVGLNAVPIGKALAKGGKALAMETGQQLNRAIIDGTGPLARVVPQSARPLGMVGNDVSYRSSHAAPSREFGATLDDLTGIYPADVYSKQGPRIYGTGMPYDKKAFDIVNKTKGNPDAEVTIYRAVPSEVTSADINRGDWVAITQEYASDHGESVLRGDYKIITKKVKARDIYTNGDSIQEWGYDPAEKGTK